MWGLEDPHSSPHSCTARNYLLIQPPEATSMAFKYIRDVASTGWTSCCWSSTEHCLTVSFCFNKPKASSKIMSKCKVNTSVTVFSCHYQVLCAAHNGKFCTWNTFKAVCLFTPTASLWGQWRHWAIELHRCSNILQEQCHSYCPPLPDTSL